MNQLYRIIPKVYLNDIELCDRGFCKCSLHYGEIPELDSLKITNFDEAWNNTLLLCSCDISIFKKKYISNNEPYPLCKGNGEIKCRDCCLFEDYTDYNSPHPEEIIYEVHVEEENNK